MQNKLTTRFFWTLLFIFAAQILVLYYVFSSFYHNGVADIKALGVSNMKSQGRMIENYLGNGRDIMWLAADSVDFMMKNGADNQAILQYLSGATEKMQQQFDTNFTGIYGYLQGEYIDGFGWTPPADFNPVERDWYKEAKRSAGELVVSRPYVDLQTGDIVISFSQLLSDGQSVLSLDMVLDEVQKSTESMNVNGDGYGFIVDRNGLVIAHSDKKEKGKNYATEQEWGTLLSKVYDGSQGEFEANIDGERCTIFSEHLVEDWYVVVVVSNVKLFQNLRLQLIVGVVLTVVTFFLSVWRVAMAERKEWEIRRQAEQVDNLRKAKEIADRASQAKSNFLAQMSHEIRTPINAVLGMNEVILRESVEPAIRTYAQKIDSAGRSLLALINDILDFSKIEAGRMELTEGRYQLDSMLNDILNIIEPRAKKKGLKLITQVEPHIPNELWGDVVRVRQIVLNLLTNAVKYTPSGRVTFDVTFAAADEQNIKLNIKVQDTGMGIREEDRARLFNDFERLDTKKNRHIEGTGLGLAITQKLLVLMGGDIRVESVYGEGSVFYLGLPQGVKGTDEVGDFAGRRAALTNRIAAHQTKFFAPRAKVLVVDDNEMNLFVAQSLLKETKVQVTVCLSGQECLNLMSQEHYDAVLLDHMMPEMDGMETLTKIKEIPDNSSIPIIALTANAVTGAKEMFLAAGFADYITKPVSGNVLEEKLLKHLPADLIEQTRSGEKI